MGDDAHTSDPADSPQPTASEQPPAGEPASEAETSCVSRSVEINAPVDDVWDAVSDPDQRSAWLDDDDALARVTRIDWVEPGRSLSWTWWHPDDAEAATQVQVTLDEPATGITRVIVTERRPTLASRTGLTAQASATSLRATASAWDYRLLGLELLLFAVNGVRI